MSSAPENRYCEQFTIRASEVDPRGRATLQAICLLLQEVAGNNALELNFDISQLNTRNMTWILHRLHLQMDCYPEWRDTITIETWPAGGKGLRAYRDFRILDDDGVEMGRSISYWLMVNMQNRRPVRIPQEIKDMAPHDSAHVLPVHENRINVGEADDECPAEFRVRKGDLDMNGHLNNVKYIEWALARLSDDQQALEIDIEFRSECTLGDVITSHMDESQPGRPVHILWRSEDKTVVAVARSRYQQL